MEDNCHILVFEDSPNVTMSFSEDTAPDIIEKALATLLHNSK